MALYKSCWKYKQEELDSMHKELNKDYLFADSIQDLTEKNKALEEQNKKLTEAEEKKKLEEEKRKKLEEEKRKKLEEEKRKEVEKQKQCDATNINIRKRIILDKVNTFTDVTLTKPSEFLVYNGTWSHHIAWWHSNLAKDSYDNMPTSFLTYFDEGKVPFCTKCPRCNSPTKFNYLDIQYFGGGSIGETLKSNTFKEVYCDNHYFYDSINKKHYIEDPTGIIINFIDPYKRANIPSWQTAAGGWSCVATWRPSNTKWKEWDPSNPDGKKAESLDKKKELHNIQKEIAELQIKLSELKLREILCKKLVK